MEWNLIGGEKASKYFIIFMFIKCWTNNGLGMMVLDTAIEQFVESWKKNFLDRNGFFDRKSK